MDFFSILGFLAPFLGYVMQFIYNFVNNYGVAIIVFTIIIRVLMFPLTIMQQKTTAKNAAYQPMIQEIQKKWANDRNRQQQELMKFQEENGMKMTAGCLPMLLNMVVLFSVIAVIYRPLQYILGVDTATIAQATAYLQGLPDIGTVSDYTAQSLIIGYVNSGDAGMLGLELMTPDVVATIQGFNFDFLTLNLAQVPQFRMDMIPYLILPILSLLTMFLSQIIVMKTSGSQQAGMGKSMLVMTVVMGVMFGFYAFTVPVGFSLYYTVSNILALVQQLIVKRIYDPEKMKQAVLDEFEERKKAKKAKKTVKVKDESGNVIDKEMSDDEIARLRLAKARELDAKRYTESEEDKKKAEEAQKKIEEKQAEKDAEKSEENTDNTDGEGETETVTAAPAEDGEAQQADGDEGPTIPEAPAMPAAPEMPKQEYKPGRRKRASNKKQDEGDSFADKERAAENKDTNEE